jgi:serine/threonine-protein kinase RIO1
MTYTRAQLIHALQSEYELLIHDDFDPAVDMSAADHLEYLNSLNVEQLIDVTDCDATYTLDEFMHNHG